MSISFDPITNAAVTALGSKISNGVSFANIFISSGTFTAPSDGVALIRVIGGGGSGGNGNASKRVTGGYSGSWAMKVLRMKKGETLTVSVGAGGAAQTTNGAAGNAGGATSVTYDGVSHSTPGGYGGESASSPSNPNGPVSSDVWWDKVVSSVKPGQAPLAANQPTGGAGVDILGQGGNATTSQATYGSGGGGTGSASTSNGGGALDGGYSVLGKAPSNPPDFVPCLQDEWGLPFYGGNGGGGSGSGGNGGGGGGAPSSYSSGAGGKGYAFVKFFAAG